MSDEINCPRRALLGRVALGLMLGPVAMRQAFGATAISESDPAAMQLHYVEDASRAKEAKPGNTCANCSLYTADSRSVQGPCLALNSQEVKATGWCSAWTDL